MSDPDFSSSINPYAPSTDAPLVDELSAKVAQSAVGGGNIVWMTICGVSLSGCVFGIGTGLVMIASELFNGSFNDIGGFLIILLFGGIVGLIWALLGSLFVVPISYFIATIASLHGSHWTGRSIRVFGSITGFLTGFLCLTVPTGFDLSALAMGIVPGVIGALGTLFVVRRLARRTDEALALEAAIEDEIAANESEFASESDRSGLAANPFTSES